MNTLTWVNTSIMAWMAVGCGGQDSHSNADQIRTQLRHNAEGASKFKYDKPLGKSRVEPKTKPLQRNVEQGLGIQRSKRFKGLQCFDDISCFPTETYLCSEGMGGSEREAELDAKTRLSSRIRSEVSGSVSTFTKEGDGQNSRSEGEIRSEVKTYFSNAELIEIVQIPNRDTKSKTKRALAVLDKRKYDALISEKINPLILDLTKRLASVDETTPIHELRELKPIISRFSSGFTNMITEYKTIMGVLPKGYSALSERIKAIRRGVDHRRAKLIFIVELNGDERDEGLIRQLVKSLVSESNLRVKSPGECLKGQYQLLVPYQYITKVHPLTGSQVVSLKWAAKLYQCNNDGLGALLGEQALPVIRGVERYQQSAHQVISTRLKKIQKEVVTSNQHVKQDKLTQPVKDSIGRLLNDVIPTF